MIFAAPESRERRAKGPRFQGEGRNRLQISARGREQASDSRKGEVIGLRFQGEEGNWSNLGNLVWEGQKCGLGSLFPRKFSQRYHYSYGFTLC